jgi:hypothetical protein
MGSSSLCRLAPSILLITIGCGDSGGGAAPSSKPAGSTVESSKPAPKASEQPTSAAAEADLAPLPLKASLPGVNVKKMDEKSVLITNAELPEGLNIGKPKEKTFDDVKKSVKAEKTIFTFTKWVEESGTSAIAEVKAGGLMGGEEKTAYFTFAWKEIGGQPYLCKSSGLNGLKSIDDAKRFVKACDAIAAK